MRNFYPQLAAALILTLLLGSRAGFAQNVGINATGTPPESAAGLDVNFADKGLLIPRVLLTGSTDVTTIPSPIESLLVYNTGTNNALPAGYYYWSGTAWVKLSTSSTQWTSSGTDLTYTSGKVGIGTTTPSNLLHLAGEDPLKLEGVQTGTTTDSVLTVNGGVVKKVAQSELAPGNVWTWGGNEPTEDQVIGTTNDVNLSIISNSIEAIRVSTEGKVGLGTLVPENTLHVSGVDPLKLEGVQTEEPAINEVLTIDDLGVVKKTSRASLAASNSWLTTGNPGAYNGYFIGTTDTSDLVIKTNNTEALRITKDGNIAIGTDSLNQDAPEKFLVDVGTEGSINAISARGNNNSYVQINVQNRSAGEEASSDIVATANNGDEDVNYINMGINSEFNNAGGTLGGPNKAYLFSTGADFVIGNGTPGRNLTLYSTTMQGPDTLTTEKFRLNSTGVTFSQSLVKIDTHYSITIDDYTILCDLKSTSPTNVNVQLPDATQFAGRVFFIKRIDNLTTSKYVYVFPAASQTIDGSPNSKILNKQFGGMMLQSDGANWYMILENI